SLLGKIGRISLAPTKAETKAVKIAIIKLHQAFELKIGRHVPSSLSGMPFQSFCSRDHEKFFRSWAGTKTQPAHLIFETHINSNPMETENTQNSRNHDTSS